LPELSVAASILTCHAIVPQSTTPPSPDSASAAGPPVAPPVAAPPAKFGKPSLAFVFTPRGRSVQTLAFKERLGWPETTVAPPATLTSTCASFSASAAVTAWIDVNAVTMPAAGAATPATDVPFVGNFSVAQAQDGCPCPGCNGSLVAMKGVEVGHVFYLGTKYSKTLGAKFLNQQQKHEIIEMGCFGNSDIPCSRNSPCVSLTNHHMSITSYCCVRYWCDAHLGCRGRSTSQRRRHVVARSYFTLSGCHCIGGWGGARCAVSHLVRLFAGPCTGVAARIVIRRSEYVIDIYINVCQ
jgi:hypothetical protein